MKLIIAIVPDSDSDALSASLTSASLRVTTIASTGGFLRHGHSTMLVGVEDDKVEAALGIIRQVSHKSNEPTTKRGVVFVLKVDQYLHL
jgi:uncharacterized protein YaaQ